MTRCLLSLAFRLILLSLWLHVPTTFAAGVLSENVAVLVDADGVETIGTVSADAATSRFRPVKGAFMAGYTRKVHWLRVTFRPPAAGEWWLELQPSFLDDVRFFLPTAQGFEERLAGDRLPMSSREENDRHFVFKMKFADVQPRTVYLRIQTSSTTMASLQWWTPESFRSAKSAEYMALGFYYGLVALVAILNFMLWVWLRDELYGWFVLQVCLNLLMSLGINGFVAQFLFPESPAISDAWVGTFLFLTFAGSAPFYRRILRVERDDRVFFTWFRILQVLPVLMLLSIPLGLFTEAARFLVPFMFVTIIAALYLSIRLLRQGRSESHWIILGNVFSILGGLSGLVSVLGISPVDMLTIGWRQVMVLGNILSMQLALAIRINAMYAERQDAFQRAHDAEKDAASQRTAHEEQGRFIAMLSHELKTPLAVIDGAAQALERIDRSHDPEVARRHERIRRSVRRIDRLVEQFLNKDRIDAESMALKRCDVHVGDVLRQIVDISAEADRIHVTAPHMAHLQADPALLQVAVSNLVDNALKYAPPESPIRLSAMPRMEGAQSGIEIVIMDEGPGLPVEIMGKLFARYARGPNVGHVSGAGLGLYLVRRVAELHGGLVDVRSGEHGTVFRIWLPCEAAT